MLHDPRAISSAGMLALSATIYVHTYIHTHTRQALVHEGGAIDLQNCSEHCGLWTAVVLERGGKGSDWLTVLWEPQHNHQGAVHS